MEKPTGICNTVKRMEMKSNLVRGIGAALLAPALGLLLGGCGSSPNGKSAPAKVAAVPAVTSEQPATKTGDLPNKETTKPSVEKGANQAKKVETSRPPEVPGKTETADDKKGKEKTPEPAKGTDSASPPKVAAVAASAAERFLLFTPRGPLVVELELTIDGQPHVAAMDKLVTEVLKLADTDADGRPTWKEVTASKRFMYGQFGNLPVSNENGIKQILDLYDADKDGVVDRAEVPRFLTRNAGGARAFSMRGTADFRDSNRFDSPLWNLLNTDEERRTISAAEMQAAPARLRSRDGDDDDVLQAGDFAVAPPTQPGEAPARRRVRGPDAARLLGTHANWDLIRVELDEEYALGGQLSPANFPLTPDLFSLLDADKSGRLSKQEYLHLDKVPAHIRLAVNFGSPAKPAEQADVKSAPETPPADPQAAMAAMLARLPQVRLISLSPELQKVGGATLDQPGRLSLSIGGMALTFYTNDTVASADFEAQAKQALDMFDADKNGYLEAKEVPADAQAAFGNFEAIDTDVDAKVYPGEIVAFLSQQQAALRGQIHAKAEDREDALFLALDANGDERLDGQEIDGAPQRLAKFDADGDGELVGDEIPAAMIVGLARGSLQNVDALFVPPVALAPPPGKESPLWFTRMDTSGDRVISRREFLGTPEQFQTLDANKDGFVDAAEAAAAKSP